MDDITMKVWYLERSLFRLFPAKDVVSWDNCGLLCGDMEDTITGIAVALDPTIDNIHAARDGGCNVLFTHHPAFTRPPDTIIASGPNTWSTHGTRETTVEKAYGGTLIHEAIRSGVNLIAMHSNFDVSVQAQHILPDALGFTYLNPIEQTSSEDGSVGSGGIQGGLGQLSSVPETTLRELGRRCHEVFGAAPRCWGDPDARIELVATIPGSAWPLINDATECEFDCCICGETRYHTAMAAVASGNCIIELGHDISENLYIDSFHDILLGLGYPEEIILQLPPQQNWWTA